MLYENQFLISSNQRFKAILQTNALLVIIVSFAYFREFKTIILNKFLIKDMFMDAQIWSSTKPKNAGSTKHPFRLVMQADNNLVIYDSAFVYLWTSWTNNPTSINCVLQMRDDGNLVIVQSDGSIVWQSNTTTSRLNSN
jgi:hypothetical protein